MNTFQIQELAAAERIRAAAAWTASLYAAPEDSDAATLALLMLAAEQEAQAQGIRATLVFK